LRTAMLPSIATKSVLSAATPVDRPAIWLRIARNQRTLWRKTPTTNRIYFLRDGIIKINK
jgi:hypothetical protein